MVLTFVVIGGLITWRVSNIIVKQKGPLDSMVRLRAYLASKQQRSGGLFDLVSCMTCTSVTVGAVTALAFAGDPLEWILYGLAFSAVSSVTDALMTSRGYK